MVAITASHAPVYYPVNKCVQSPYIFFDFVRLTCANNVATISHYSESACQTQSAQFTGNLNGVPVVTFTIADGGCCSGVDAYGSP